MKNIYILFILSLTILSCSGKKELTIDQIIATGNAKAMQTKKETLVAQQLDLVNQIKLLDEQLENLSPDRNIPLITAIPSKTSIFKHYLELQGAVETKQNLVVTPEMGGILTRVFVKEGQRVNKGQLLASIDDGGLSQQKAQLQIQTDLAQTTFERQKRLWDQKIGSEIQYLQAKSQYEGLQKSIIQMDKQLAKANIRAPFSGVVDDIITEQGNVVAPGQSPILRIVNLNNMYIKTEVPERYITDITKGKEVLVEFPVLGKSLNAKIRQTGNFINPSNRTFNIEIAVPNKDKTIKPNLTARLKINDYTNTEALLIPQSIISENANGEQYIYILKNINKDRAVAKQVFLETGKTQGNDIEILSGLKSGQMIIKEGARSVKDGQTVKVSK